MKHLAIVASLSLIFLSIQAFALEANTLSGTSWELNEYNGESATGTLSFTDDMVYSKFCNNVSQKYTYDGTVLASDGNGISTMMYCE